MLADLKGRAQSRTWHAGAGYILSWDLVAWLRDNPTVCGPFMYGGEDMATGQMLQAGDKGHNFIDLQYQVMDHPAYPESSWTRPFGSDVILVHQLKSLWQKGDTIEHFLGLARNRSKRHGNYR